MEASGGVLDLAIMELQRSYLQRERHDAAL